LSDRPSTDLPNLIDVDYLWGTLLQTIERGDDVGVANERRNRQRQMLCRPSSIDDCAGCAEYEVASVRPSTIAVQMTRTIGRS
jgi:hypothetical protein